MYRLSLCNCLLFGLRESFSHLPHLFFQGILLCQFVFNGGELCNECKRRPTEEVLLHTPMHKQVQCIYIATSVGGWGNECTNNNSLFHHVPAPSQHNNISHLLAFNSVLSRNSVADTKDVHSVDHFRFAT